MDFPAVLGANPAIFPHGTAFFKEIAADRRPVPLTVDAGVRIEDGARFADHFLAPVPRDLFRGKIEGEDGAFAIHEHQAVAHGLEDVLQKLGSFFEIVKFHVYR